MQALYVAKNVNPVPSDGDCDTMCMLTSCLAMKSRRTPGQYTGVVFDTFRSAGSMEELDTQVFNPVTSGHLERP